MAIDQRRVLPNLARRPIQGPTSCEEFLRSVSPSGHSYDVAYSFNPAAPITAYLDRVRIYMGFIWVVGFIVLSGYCISRSRLTGRHPFSFPRYLALRVTRIFPLLFACAALAGILEWIMYGSPFRPGIWNDGITLPAWKHTALGMAGFSVQFGSLAPSYTISYELLYYLLWGLVCLVPVRARIAPLICLAFAVALYGLTFWVPVSFLAHWWLDQTFTHWVMMLFVVWAIGSLLAPAEGRVISLLRRLPKWAGWAAWWAFAVAIAKLGHGRPYPRYDSSTGVDFWCYLGCAVFFCLLIGTAFSRKASTPRLSRWMGDISYPLFLIHGPIVIFVGYVFHRLGMVPTVLECFSACLGASILAAQLLLMDVERPVMTLRRLIRR